MTGAPIKDTGTMIRCPHCGRDIRVAREACPYCDQPITPIRKG